MDQACRGAEPSGLWMDSVLCSSAGVQCSSEDIERWGTVWVDACNDPLDGVKACEPIQCGVWKTSQMAVNYTKTCGGCDDELFAYFECGIASGIWDWYIVSDDLVTKASGSNPCTWKHGSGAEFQRYTTTYPNKKVSMQVPGLGRPRTGVLRQRLGQCQRDGHPPPRSGRRGGGRPLRNWAAVAATRRMNISPVDPYRVIRPPSRSARKTPSPRLAS